MHPPPPNADQADRPPPSSDQRPDRVLSYRYEITGSAAHSRVAPLLPPHWIDCSPYAASSASNANNASNAERGMATAEEDDAPSPTSIASIASTVANTCTNTCTNTPTDPSSTSGQPNKPPIDFLWSNAPRHHTKPYRDHVSCYSHLPNGTRMLDDKWILARLLGGGSNCYDNGAQEEGKGEQGLESHCFCGPDGFETFGRRVGLLPQHTGNGIAGLSCVPPQTTPRAQTTETPPNDGSDSCSDNVHAFPELTDRITRPIHDGNDERDGGGSAVLPPPEPSNLWVVKDAQSNGAGGIWIVDPTNAATFLPSACYREDRETEKTGGDGGDWESNRKDRETKKKTTKKTTPLIDGHRYVAQRYVWPPVLYGGRKFHIRVYGCVTAEGTAWIHRKCFLHVANEKFEYDCGGGGESGGGGGGGKSGDEIGGDGNGGGGNGNNSGGGTFDPSVHITNCCANSHDDAKFAGEICADLGISYSEQVDEDGDKEDHVNDPTISTVVVPLGEYYPSISATVATLARRAMPYLTGGTQNGGFEYLGIDFILSTRKVIRDTSSGEGEASYQPTAHLLEVNAPPSQDTATGLPHAEELHDAVIRDLLTMWVIPHVDPAATSKPGGWMCVYDDCQMKESEAEGERVGDTDVLPSKAAMLNKMRWSINEWKLAKRYEEEGKRLQAEARSMITSSTKALSGYVRCQFPFYSNAKSDQNNDIIFVENAGGSQVPESVIQATNSSLSNRHRCFQGSRAKSAARSTLLSLLGASPMSHHMILGANATSLLDTLAQQYVRSGCLKRGDEIVIATENHSANITPWLRAAESVGARIVWWEWTHSAPMEDISTLITNETRIVAVSHASNIVGELRNIRDICQKVQEKSAGRAHVIVDGVAAAPHICANVAASGAHWYAVSCHKLFGPHLGGLCGARAAVESLIIEHTETSSNDDKVYRTFELGTLNFEGCAGVGFGIKQYFTDLSNYDSTDSTCQRRNDRNDHTASLLSSQVDAAYQRIGELEASVCATVSDWLRKMPQVVVIEDIEDRKISNGRRSLGRIPIVSFFHRNLTSDEIARACLESNIICRSDTFLAGSKFLQELKSMGTSKLVRLSFAHYNTVEEGTRVCGVLAAIPGW